MTREEAIDYIWAMSTQIDGEFCCGRAESDALRQDTADALEALESGGGGFDPYSGATV